MGDILALLPLIVPLFLIQLGLAIYALFALKGAKKVKGDSKLVWVFIILLVNLIGPILFLTIGRVNDDVSAEDE